MRQVERKLVAIEDNSTVDPERSPAAINLIALLLAIVTAMAGVGALELLAEHNGHHGTRAGTMSIVWCVFVGVMLLNTLFKKA